MTQNQHPKDKSPQPRLLIIDDEPFVISALIRILRPTGLEILSAGTGAEALEVLQHNLIDVILLDVKLPDISGLEVLRQVKQIDPETVVIIITGHGTVRTAVEAMKDGAFEFITKPFETNDLVVLTVTRALEYKRLHEKNRELQSIISGQAGYKNLIATSAAMQRILRLVDRLAAIDSTILITGETGTGKEVLARAIHFAGPRRSHKFIPVDCGAIPAGVIESELFGHLKGAYTGAALAAEGLLKMADQGTVFFDEIGELPLEMQTRLLRFLQDREVRPVGGSTTTKVEVRVIAATHRDLGKMVAEGKFREDLFFRLNVVNLEVPPLRERKEDLPALIQHLMEKHAAHLNTKIALSAETFERLTEYRWPGNIRELENVIIQVLSLCTGDAVRPEDLPPALQNLAPARAAVISEQIPLSLEAYEKLAIERALAHCRGNINDAAKVLNIGKSTLYRKISTLNINPKTA
jgi:DNA-binding NtrC family response regulator